MATPADGHDLVDVLVVGAGPTGLALAADLARREVSLRVVDRKDGPERWWKAGNPWPRTQELLSGLPHGLMGRLAARSLVVRAVHVHGYGRHLSDTRGDRYDESPYNAVLLNGQNVIEGVLSGNLDAGGVAVEYGAAFVEGEDRGSHVEAIIERDGGVRDTVRARYVVGCDGGRSAVRRAAGLDFEPEPQEGVQLLLCDARLSWARPTSPDRMWMFLHDRGYYGVNPYTGGYHHLWRFESAAEPQQTAPTLDEMQEALREASGDPTVTLSNGQWFSHIANPRAGVAPDLRRGRFVLAGDAGHVSLPVGGQGMNTGIQDAFNLGWKLAAVARGEAPDALLDSYAAERLPIRQGLLRDQVAGLNRLLHPGALQRFGVRVLAPLLARFGGAIEFQGRRSAAMLDIAYPDGPLSEDGLGRGGVRAGERAPDAMLARAGGQAVTLFDCIYHHGGWTLLVLDGGEGGSATVAAVLAAARAAARERSPGRLRVHPILSASAPQGGSSNESPEALFDLDGLAHGALGVARPAFVLVRPDGHVGYRGLLSNYVGLRTYLAHVIEAAREEVVA